MSFRPLIFLGGSCAIAFALALYALASGVGFLAAFMIYSLGGSGMLVALSMISYFRYEQNAAGLQGPEQLVTLGRFQNA